MRMNHSSLIRNVLVSCVFLSLFTPGLLQAAHDPFFPHITSPPHEPPLSGATETFSWTPRFTPNVIEWWLYIGTSQGTNDIYDSGRILGVDMNTDTVSGLPVDGSTIHVRLWWKVLGQGWSTTDQPFTTNNRQAVTRYSAVDTSVQVRASTDLSEPITFIRLPVTTTTTGTFVMGFSSRTHPQVCPDAPGNPCASIQVIQTIVLDGRSIGEPHRSSKVIAPDGRIEQYMSWTASANNIQPGAHTVEVKVACSIPGTSTTCVDLGYTAASTINTLWAIHPE